MTPSSRLAPIQVTEDPSPIATKTPELLVPAHAIQTLSSPLQSSSIGAVEVVSYLNRTASPQPESDEEFWSHVADEDDIEIMENSLSVTAPTALPGSILTGTSSASSTDFQKHRYYREILDVLKRTFKLSKFRHNQLEAIIHTLEGRDVVVLMPTGGGKSLCYQVPALCNGGTTHGVTVVISPLLALMFDQVEDLRALGVDVGLFASDQTLAERNNTRHRLLSPGTKPNLVYITPEKLNLGGDMSKILRKLYTEKMLARFVVDEAHLINTWGRDFRDAYAALNNLRRDFPGIPIMALTATATPTAQQDIIHSLGLHDYKFLAQSFNRPNLRYCVVSKPRAPAQSIAKYIKEVHPGHTGIVYCLGRDKCERVASDLRKEGIAARHFHAKMADADKRRTHEAWKTGECTVIVGTIAFGMGINKANVRYVIHHDMPSSLAGYLQETGRAGRDGEVSDCLLYYSWQDGQMLLRRVRENPDLGVEEIRRQEEEVRAVIQFCLNDTDCRRVQLLTRFDEIFHPETCAGTCDNCISTDGVLEQDMSGAAKNFIRLLQQVENRNDNITRGHCIATFRGLQPKEVIEKGYHMLELYGIGRDMEQGQAERLFDHLLMFEAFKSVSIMIGKYPATYIRVSFLSTHPCAQIDVCAARTEVPRNSI
ncbi:P-loop containing nucleoside triphosphate hydrolase protein [Amylostereum chailletii]|nr:P-loop containing nucleoside triphosphate hydrolase protein [Amylostereum chailletii]